MQISVGAPPIAANPKKHPNKNIRILNLVFNATPEIFFKGYVTLLLPTGMNKVRFGTSATSLLFVSVNLLLIKKYIKEYIKDFSQTVVSVVASH